VRKRIESTEKTTRKKTQGKCEKNVWFMRKVDDTFRCHFDRIFPLPAAVVVADLRSAWRHLPLDLRPLGGGGLGGG